MSSLKERVESHPLGYAVAIAIASGTVVAGVMLWFQSTITAGKDAVIQQKDALIELLRARPSAPLKPSVAVGSGNNVTMWKFAGPVTQKIIGAQYNLLSPGTLPTLNVLDSNDIFEVRFSVSCWLTNRESFTSSPVFTLGYAVDGPPPREGSLNNQGLHVIQTGRFDLNSYVDDHLGGTAILTGLKPGSHTIGVWVAAHFLAPAATLRLMDFQMSIIRLGSPEENMRGSQVK